MASITEICNLALSHLGVGAEIASLDERSAEARACKRFFSLARDATLRSFPWPFATKVAPLALIEETPNDQWLYSYAYPTDCLNVRGILSGVANPQPSDVVPLRIIQGAAGLLIYTNRQDAEIEYTARTENTSLYPPDFTTALSLLLAVMVAPRVTGSDPFKMAVNARAQYDWALGLAKTNALNEEQWEVAPESEFIRVRG